MENNKIIAIRVYLDDDLPDYMLGVTRLSNIEIEYENGEIETTSDHCNQEFINEAPDDVYEDTYEEENKVKYPTTEERIRKFVAQQLGVDIDIIEVIE